MGSASSDSTRCEDVLPFTWAHDRFCRNSKRDCRRNLWQGHLKKIEQFLAELATTTVRREAFFFKTILCSTGIACQADCVLSFEKWPHRHTKGTDLLCTGLHGFRPVSVWKYSFLVVCVGGGGDKSLLCLNLHWSYIDVYYVTLFLSVFFYMLLLQIGAHYKARTKNSKQSKQTRTVHTWLCILIIITLV